MKTAVGDIVLVEITVPVVVGAESRHTQVEVPAFVTVMNGDTDSGDLSIAATTIATPTVDPQIYSAITLYPTREAGRAREDGMPVFAYLRPGTETEPTDDL